MFMPSSLSFWDSLFDLCAPPIFPSPLRRTTTLPSVSGPSLVPLNLLLSVSVLSHASLFYTFSCSLLSESSPLPSNMLSSPQVEIDFHRAASSLITALPFTSLPGSKVFTHHLYSITDSHINTPGWGSCPQHLAEIYSHLKIMERKKLVAWNFFLVLSPQPFRILWSIWQLILIFILLRWISYKIKPI